jgi:hypothetical protein
MKYVDPDGEMPWIIIGAAVIGGAINVASHWDNINSASQFLGYFAVGAVSGTLGVVTGGATSVAIGGMTGILGGAAVGLASGTASGGLLGVGNTIMDGGSPLDAMEAGINGAFFGGLEGMITGGFLGGVEAGLTGRNVWTGAEKMVPVTPLDRVEPVGIQDIQNSSKVEPQYSKNKQKPIQEHHFVTNKNMRFTPEMEKTLRKYELDLKGSWNREKLPHVGRHPNEYHQWVLDNINSIDNTPQMNQREFLIQFDIRVKQPIRNNPEMLYKNYWKNK